MKYLFLSFIAVFFAFTPANALTESQKIDKLIEYVHSMKDVTFIRNGSEYAATRAADHLKMKRESAGNNIKTARQFIKDIASVSSMSGKPYMIKFKDGKTYKCGDVLMQYLEKMEKGS